MGHVFISYSRKDAELARKIALQLRDQDIPVWIDVNNVAVGSNWDQAIQQALEESISLIMIISNDSIDSQYVLFEYGYAMAQSIPVIPIIRSSSPPKAIPDNLRALQILNSDDAQLLNKITQILSENGVLSKSKPQQEGSKDTARGYIFISYSIDDIDFTLKLRTFFAEKGYAYWDYQDTHRKYDMPFHLEIEDAVRGSSAVVSVVSPDWKMSQWATREYLFSEQIGKTNFVCIVRDVGPTLLFADKTFIEFFHDEEAGFDKLDKALRRAGLID